MAKRWGCFGLALVLTLLVMAQPGFAGADDNAKQADKIVRDAERNMFDGKNEEADELLGQAQALIDEALQEDPKNSKAMQAQKKWERIRGQLDRKLDKNAKATSTAAPGMAKKPQAKPTSSSSGSSVPAAEQPKGDKLPGGVTKRLQDIAAKHDRAQRYIDEGGKNAAKDAKYQLGDAQSLFGEIDRMYAGQFDPAHPDYAAARKRYDQLTVSADAVGEGAAKAVADAAAAEEAMKKQSEAWVAKFREYLSYPSVQGHNPEKLVYVPGGAEPEKFADAQKRFEAFLGFYEEYKKTDFPNGKTWELEELGEREAPQRIEYFNAGMADRLSSASGRAEELIEQAMAQVNKDNGWKSDKKIKPHLVDRNWMSQIKDATAQALTALGDSDQGKALKAKFDALMKQDQENRQIRRERTFMIPDRYKGSDIEECRDKAGSLVENDKKGEGGKPLRTTVISENWREETIEEWTDTSKTARRWRTTRHLTAQVAANAANEVRLITVALAKDKQSDGTWGPLYGNLHQGFDPMIEANVHKDGP